MIFSSSSASSSSSSYGRRASERGGPPSLVSLLRPSVRPCPILPLLIPHKGSSFKLLWEGEGRARRKGERDRPRNEAHVTELGRGSRWRRGRNSILKSRDLESHSTSTPKSPLPPSTKWTKEEGRITSPSVSHPAFRSPTRRKREKCSGAARATTAPPTADGRGGRDDRKGTGAGGARTDADDKRQPGARGSSVPPVRPSPPAPVYPDHSPVGRPPVGLIVIVILAASRSADRA